MGSCVLVDPVLAFAPKMHTISPMVVAGCQRSGSTLVGSMLGAAEGAIAVPEAQFVADLAPVSASESRPARDWCAQIAAHPRFRIWNWVMPEPPDTKMTFGEVIRWMINAYAKDRGQDGARVWIDHQPGHVRWLSRLRTHFPDLRIVHLVRDGRAVAASLMPLDWGPNTINRAAFFWQQRLALGLAAARRFGPNRCVTVRYEDVLEDARTALQPVLRMASLSWHDSMLAGGEFQPPRFTREQHRLVGSTPQRDRATGWHAALSAREIEIFEALNGDLLEYLGYQSVSGARPRPPGAGEVALLDARHVALKLLNEWRFSRRFRQAQRAA